MADLIPLCVSLAWINHFDRHFLAKNIGEREGYTVIACSTLGKGEYEHWCIQNGNDLVRCVINPDGIWNFKQ